MAAKTMTGARAQLAIIDPNTGQSRILGIFSNVSYGLSYGAEPISILGRYSPDEIVYTSQEAVSVTANGWRVFGAGAHSHASLPALKDLLNHEYIELAIFDRQNPGQAVAKIHSVRPISYSTSVNAKQAQELTVTFLGLLVDDESTENSELPSASSLP